MNRAPLCGITFALIIGILAARYTGIPFIIFYITALLIFIFCIIFLKTRIRFIFFLILSIIFLGAAALRNSENLPRNHISNYTTHKGVTVYVEGIVDSQPVIKIDSTTFILNVERLIKDKKINDVCGKVLVKIAKKRPFLYGDRLLIQGKIYKIPYFRISKRLNYRSHLGQGHIYSMLSTNKDSIIKLLKMKNGNPFKSFAFYIRDRMKMVIANNISSFSGSILNAVILGERENLPRPLREVMVQTGTVHIIAISGLHAGLVGFVVIMALKLCRVPKSVCYILTIFILIIYSLLTGARTPVIRATLMAIIFLAGFIIHRQINLYNSLSAAALVILLFNPQELFNVSFQLSFMSMISIIWLSPKIMTILSAMVGNTYIFGKPYLHILIKLFSGSLAVWMGLLPLIAYYFNIISPIAILANMIIVPYLTIVIGSSFIFLLIGLLYQPLAFIFSQASELLIILLFKIISILARLPGAYFYLTNISSHHIILYYLSIAIFVFIGRELSKNWKEPLKIN